MGPKKKGKAQRSKEELALDAELAAKRAEEQRLLEEERLAALAEHAERVAALEAEEDVWLLERHRMQSQHVWWTCQFDCDDETAGDALAVGGTATLRLTRRLQERFNALHEVDVQVGPPRLLSVSFGFAADGDVTPDDRAAVMKRVCLGMDLRSELSADGRSARVHLGDVSQSHQRLVVRGVRDMAPITKPGRERGTAPSGLPCAAQPVVFRCECNVTGSRWGWQHMYGVLVPGFPHAAAPPPPTLVATARALREWGAVRATVQAVALCTRQALRECGAIQGNQQPQPVDLASVLTPPPPVSSLPRRGSMTSSPTLRSPKSFIGDPTSPRRYQVTTEFAVGDRVEVRGRLAGAPVRFQAARSGMVLRMTPSPRSFTRLCRAGGDGPPQKPKPGRDVYVAEVSHVEGDTIVLTRDWVPVLCWQAVGGKSGGAVERREPRTWWEHDSHGQGAEWRGPRQYELSDWRPAVVTALPSPPSSLSSGLRCRADGQHAADGAEWDGVRRPHRKSLLALAPASPPGGLDRWDCAVRLCSRLQRGCFAAGADARLAADSSGGWNDAESRRGGAPATLEPDECGCVLAVMAPGDGLYHKVQGPRGGTDWYPASAVDVRSDDDSAQAVGKEGIEEELRRILKQDLVDGASKMVSLNKPESRVPVGHVMSALAVLTDDQVGAVLQLLRKSPQFLAALVCQVTEQELRMATRVLRVGQKAVVMAELELQPAPGAKWFDKQAGGKRQQEQQEQQQGAVSPRALLLTERVALLESAPRRRVVAQAAVAALLQDDVISSLRLPEQLDPTPCSTLNFETLTEDEVAGVFAPPFSGGRAPPPLLVCVASSDVSGRVRNPERVHIFNAFAQDWQTMCPSLRPTGIDFLLVHACSAKPGSGATCGSKRGLARLPARLAVRLLTDAVLLLDRAKQRFYLPAGDDVVTLPELRELCSEWAGGSLSRISRPQVRVGTAECPCVVTIRDTGAIYATHARLAEQLGVADLWVSGTTAPVGSLAEVIARVVCEGPAADAPDRQGVRCAVRLLPEEGEDLVRSVVLIALWGLDPQAKSVETLAANIVQRYDTDADRLLSRADFREANLACGLTPPDRSDALFDELCHSRAADLRRAREAVAAVASAAALAAAAAVTVHVDPTTHAAASTKHTDFVPELECSAASRSSEPERAAVVDAAVDLISGREVDLISGREVDLISGREVEMVLRRDPEAVRACRRQLTLPQTQRGTRSACGRFLLL